MATALQELNQTTLPKPQRHEERALSKTEAASELENYFATHTQGSLRPYQNLAPHAEYIIDTITQATLENSLLLGFKDSLNYPKKNTNSAVHDWYGNRDFAIGYHKRADLQKTVPLTVQGLEELARSDDHDLRHDILLQDGQLVVRRAGGWLKAKDHLLEDILKPQEWEPLNRAARIEAGLNNRDEPRIGTGMLAIYEGALAGAGPMIYTNKHPRIIMPTAPYKVRLEILDRNQ
jgi:hypothetical protein